MGCERICGIVHGLFDFDFIEYASYQLSPTCVGGKVIDELVGSPLEGCGRRPRDP
jgi:hypothetical protein